MTIRSIAWGVAVCGLFSCTTAEPQEEKKPPKVEAGTQFDNKKAETKNGGPQMDTKAAAPRGKQVPAPADVAGPPATAQTTQSGLAYKVLQPGTGTDHPTADDSVSVQYTGWTTDGVTFDTTSTTSKPRTFPVGRVIPGWTEALQLMVVGEKAMFWIPEDLAYKGRKGAPQGMLVFEVELVEIHKAPPTPEDVSAAPADAKKTKSGISYKVLAKGTGKEHPREFDKVKVHYTGWTSADGKMFDSSITKGNPASFPLNRVIPGWTEGVALMVVGEKTRFWIPVDLAYKNQPGKPPGDLTFEVELLEIEKMPEPPKAPKDVAKPPGSAKKTDSGLAYKVLKKGTGDKHPTKQSRVTVHYTGWTTDGKMFDSSVTRGQPATFGLGRVIAGWTEGLQLMVAGEKTRFWIPVDLAYKGQPGKPAGMLVFDVELLEIK